MRNPRDLSCAGSCRSIRFGEHLHSRVCGTGAASAFRGRVHQSTLIPKFIDAAIEPQGGQVAFETLTVVAHLFDDVVGPAIVEPEHFAEPALGADESLNDWIFTFCLLINILRREPEFLRLN